MAVQMPAVAFLFMHRLVNICSRAQRHVTHKEILVRHTKSRLGIRPFSISSVLCDENKREGSDPPGTRLIPRPALRAQMRRPLSPLERISSLLPQDALSPEVQQLREQDQQSADSNSQAIVSQEPPREHAPDDHQACDAAAESDTPSASLPGERLLTYGEMLMAELFKKGRVEYKKLFMLERGTRLQSSWGFISHDHIAGRPACQFLKSTQGVRLLIRRASLEDYVLQMKRAPAIVYPKDAATMLMMMDVVEGDCVLESGSGSGALSLFLSRAVGSKGSVVSVEVRKDHLTRARLNYNRWRASWSLRRGQEWPDNVQFFHADLCQASPLLDGREFHASAYESPLGGSWLLLLRFIQNRQRSGAQVALDMIHPQLVLPRVIPHLHPGAVCAVYLANITQVIDLLEGLRCLSLPLLCEHIIEVPIRQWLVIPAVNKEGQFCSRKAPTLDEEHSEVEEEEQADETDKEELVTNGHPAFGTIPYIARPDPEQMSHSAFLVKLRKTVG